MQIISHRNFTLVAHDDSEGETRVANYNKPTHTVHRHPFPQFVPDEYAADPHLEMMMADGHVVLFEPPVPVEVEMIVTVGQLSIVDVPAIDPLTSKKSKWKGSK